MDSSVIKKVKEYSERVKKYIPVKKIILYGSYAKGKEWRESDIDVAVVVDEIKGKFLEVSAHLFTLTRGIDSSIEPKLINEKYTKSGFLESILKYGIILYDREKELINSW